MSDLQAASRTLARHAERGMTDRCTITAQGGEPVYDPETNSYQTPDRTVIYEGRCRVVATAMGERIVEHAGGPITLATYRVYVPRDVDGVREGHQLEVTSSTDPALEGRTLHIADVLFSTHQPARRLVATYQHR